MDATQDNRYAASRRQVLAQFAERITGSRAGLFCVLCHPTLSAEAREALAKTAESLGYGPDGATFVALLDQEPLAPGDLFTLVEGLDPLCVVCADSGCGRALERAYRASAPVMTAAHVGGRPVRVFPDFSSMMVNPALKQQAWAQLKTLPHL